MTVDQPRINPPQPKRGIFYGWWIVLANSTISLYVAGAFWYGSGIFINPIKQELGWSTTEVSLAFSIRSAESGPLSPTIGFFVDRFGPRMVTIFGVVVTGLGFALLGQVNSLPLFYGAFMLLALGTSACTGVTSMTSISNWFIRKRGLALGVYAAGAGLSGLIVPLVAYILEANGWRIALLIIGAGMWVIGLPLAFLMRSRPEHYGLRPDGDVVPAGASTVASPIEGFTTRQALAHRGFWLICIAFTFSMTSLGAMTIFLIPYLTDPLEKNGMGMPEAIAATAVTILTLSSLAGRFGFAALGDRYDKRRILFGLFGLQAAGMLALALGSNWWHLPLFFLLFGPSYGGIIALRPAILADYFGRRSLGVIQGLSMGVMTVGGIITPLMIGGLRDATGGYILPFVVIAVMILLASPMLLLMQPPDQANLRRA